MRTLRIISGPSMGTSLVVEKEVVIGREDADLTIADSELSRRHAAVRPAARGFVVEDLGSMNGTFVNGRRIVEPVALTETATIKVGRSELSLELPRAAPTRAAPIAEVEQATRASDVPVVSVDDATRARDVPVVSVDDATRARDVPVANVEQPTRAREVPLGNTFQPTRVSDAPGAGLRQPIRAGSITPPASTGRGAGVLGRLEKVPPIVFGLVAVFLVIVSLILLLG